MNDTVKRLREENDARHDAAMELIGIVRSILHHATYKRDGSVTITLAPGTYKLLRETHNRASVRGKVEA